MRQFGPTGDPVADSANVIAGAGFRITVLDAGLVRLEYDAGGVFEDRASQAVVDRAFPPVDFDVTETDGRLTIRTTRLQLVYDKRPFSTEGLTVRAVGRARRLALRAAHGQPRRHRAHPRRRRRGRPLEPGILSADGVTVHDDSRTVLLTDDGWIAPRRPDTLDLYVFAYGRDYRAALRAFYRLTGPQPLLPRFALGNWWSRYHRYSAETYLALVDRFSAAGIPLSVAVIDMDWHLVDIDPATAPAGPATRGTASCSRPAGVPRRAARARAGDHAQRASGRGRARPRGALHRHGAAPGRRPRERAARSTSTRPTRRSSRPI